MDLADQFAFVIPDADINGRALHAIKTLYRPARDALTAVADTTAWEDFSVQLIRGCDVIDMDSQRDAEANAAIVAAASFNERKKRKDARIRELQAEIAKLRREAAAAEEETANDTEETAGDTAEEESGSAPADATLAFSF